LRDGVVVFRREWEAAAAPALARSGEEALDDLRQSLGLVVVHVVPGTFYALDGEVLYGSPPLFVLLGVAGDTRDQARLRALDPQHGRGDLAPAGQQVLGRGGTGIAALVRGIGAAMNPAVLVLPAPVLGEVARALRGEPGILGLQARSEVVEALVAPLTGIVLQLVEPTRKALRRRLPAAPADAESLEIDKAPIALGTCPGVEDADVAAHAVSDQVHRRIGRKLVEQRVQVAEVVRKPVGVAAAPLAQPATAPVRRHHEPVALQRIHHEVPRRGQ